MKTEIQNTETRALSDAELETVTGGKVAYYEMNGHWYIVGHDKHGHSTGAVQVSYRTLRICKKPETQRAATRPPFLPFGSLRRIPRDLSRWRRGWRQPPRP